MENKMTYTKAILLIVSGILSLAIYYMLEEESDFKGFLIGYGYTAFAGGTIGLMYTFFKKKRGAID